MRERSLAFSLLCLPLLAACGAQSALPVAACDPQNDGADAPICVADDAADACAAPHLVDAECDVTRGVYGCPSNARVYARAADAPPTCIPFADASGLGEALGGWGLGGSLVRVPTDDGRCLWIAEQVDTPSGDAIQNVAFEIDRAAPFGTCPTAASPAGGAVTSAVQIEGVADESIHVQIASAFRFAGVTRVAYRLFKIDPSAVFGVTDLGGGLGHWDPGAQRIVVQGTDAITIPRGLDLGTASLVEPDHAYLWGCPRPAFLVSDCVVARLDANGAMRLFAGGDGWIAAGAPPSMAATVMQSGPWVSSVVADAGSGGLLHVYASGFGTKLQTQIAPAPEGPFTEVAPLGDCELPAGDPKAYCAGPIVHTELADPTRPSEVVVSYAIGSTAANQDALMRANPGGYRSRLVWRAAP